ncbi:MAG: eukaryotic-like serine/threonine-protein kinase [Myxococcales bacterium]|jgi:serine/threonine-protein kinase|nr:eukaryotic-like serine/threonine-protein kinase [Myxococcales bacterium]
MSDFGNAQLPKAGDVIAGKYSLERIIGQGGMGAVFAARHVKLGHAVAIKVMLADRQNEEAARRFMNEGRASAHIQNEHVVRIFDIDEERGYAYMVLELLQGEDLGQVLEAQGRLAPHVAVGYVIQALDGVRQAHALGIVHRDLKPSNLFLARSQNGNVVVKVLDFGISKARGASSLDMAPHQQTSTAAMLGSPLYMSPEQLRSSKNVDARADIWAMGVILYELLTGVVPFEGDTLGALFSAILETDAPRVSSRIPDVPAGLDAIVLRCLQRRPDDRFATAADLEQQLAPFATAQSTALPMMMTAAMPSPVTVPAAAAVSAMAGATGSQGGAAYGGMNAPSASGSGSNPRITPGTVPLGASTPQPYRQTGNTWQSTGSGTRAKSSTGLVIGVLSGSLVLLALGVAGFIYSAKHVPHGGTAQGSSSGVASGNGAGTGTSAGVASADPSPASSGVSGTTASSAAAVVTAPITPPTTPASATVVAATPPTPPAGTPTTKRPPTTTTPPTAKVEPKPPPVDPPHPPPPTHTAPAPAGGTMQGSR